MTARVEWSFIVHDAVFAVFARIGCHFDTVLTSSPYRYKSIAWCQNDFAILCALASCVCSAIQGCENESYEWSEGWKRRRDNAAAEFNDVPYSTVSKGI